MSKKEKFQFYSLDRITSVPARYYVIISGRSNGKTYAVIQKALKTYHKTGKNMVYMRRWDTDLSQKYLGELMTKFTSNPYVGNDIDNCTEGRWNGYKFWAGAIYLCLRDQEGKIIDQDPKPFIHLMSINSWEHYKGSEYPDATTVLFDEFITREYYLPQEFILFQQNLSTIIRLRDDVTIYMCGNTINLYGCPYEKEMGLKPFSKMKAGDIDYYKYGESGLVVGVEYAENKITKSGKKPSDVYFAFSNPKLQTITSNSWEIDIYPHLPHKYVDKDVELSYFIVYQGHIVHCEVITDENGYWTYCHRKTTPLKDFENTIIFTADPLPYATCIKHLAQIQYPWQRKLYEQFVFGRVYYQDNELGELIRQYIIDYTH